ncbi:MAG: His-Xaa-Ser system radical SAM maturase HxsB [Desulfovibrio sp.]|nr:His-Xaa-Ser system radical SAM maturase HxsB [Desulfovibrio sp.]MBI4961157.1 His-Xaa-Ser system radical SAM maturase HxsB [Desulfovibrio sp.]
MLPHSYTKINSGDYLLTNDGGDFYYLSPNELEGFLTYKLDNSGDIYKDLVSSQFISEYKTSLSLNLAATKYRTRKGFLRNFTVLHMMVITVRCNQRCEYCQVSCEPEEASKYDMPIDTACKIVDFIFKTPSQSIKIEFQGGEPLLNWRTIKETVDYAKMINHNIKKDLEFVICTNITLLTDDQLEFISRNNIAISSSLDGSKEEHDCNRILRNGESSYNKVMEKIELARSKGVNVSTLLTVTKQNIDKVESIVDEYRRMNFDGIFFRALNPYGFASEQASKLGYTAEEFVEFYKRGLDYIIKINKNGDFFVEYYTQLLLTRILTSFPTGFVDLQSPAGTGISGVIYDYNGDIYPADEARMLARMGDDYFRLGNVSHDPYEKVFTSEKLKNIIKKSCLDTIPGCSWCAYKPYCGADPIRNYLETGDLVGHKPTSFFCKKHIGIFEHLFSLLQRASDDELDIFWSWITRNN